MQELCATINSSPDVARFTVQLNRDDFWTVFPGLKPVAGITPQSVEVKFANDSIVQLQTRVNFAIKRGEVACNPQHIPSNLPNNNVTIYPANNELQQSTSSVITPSSTSTINRSTSLYTRKKPSELLNPQANNNSQHPIDWTEGNALHTTHSKLRTSSLIAVRPSLLLENTANLDTTSSTSSSSTTSKPNNNHTTNNLGLARTCTANMDDHENTNSNNKLTESLTLPVSNGIKRGRLSTMIQRSSQTDNNSTLYDETQPIDEEDHNSQSNTTTTNIKPKRSLYTKVIKQPPSSTLQSSSDNNNNLFSSSAAAMNMINEEDDFNPFLAATDDFVPDLPDALIQKQTPKGQQQQQQNSPSNNNTTTTTTTSSTSASTTPPSSSDNNNSNNNTNNNNKNDQAPEIQLFGIDESPIQANPHADEEAEDDMLPNKKHKANNNNNNNTNNNEDDTDNPFVQLSSGGIVDEQQDASLLNESVKQNSNSHVASTTTTTSSPAAAAGSGGGSTDNAQESAIAPVEPAQQQQQEQQAAAAAATVNTEPPAEPCAMLLIVGFCPDGDACPANHTVCYDQLFTHCSTACGNAHLSGEARQTWLEQNHELAQVEKQRAQERLAQQRILSTVGSTDGGGLISFINAIGGRTRSTAAGGSALGRSDTLVRQEQADFEFAVRQQMLEDENARAEREAALEEARRLRDANRIERRVFTYSPANQTMGIIVIRGLGQSRRIENIPCTVAFRVHGGRRYAVGIIVDDDHHDLINDMDHDHVEEGSYLQFGTFRMVNLDTVPAGTRPEDAMPLFMDRQWAPRPEVRAALDNLADGADPIEVERRMRAERVESHVQRRLARAAGVGVPGVDAAVSADNNNNNNNSSRGLPLSPLTDEEDDADSDHNMDDSDDDMMDSEHEWSEEEEEEMETDDDEREYRRLEGFRRTLGLNYDEPITAAQLARYMIEQTLTEKDHAILHASEQCVCFVEYEPGDVVLTLPCFHRFHKDCVNGWLTEAHNNGKANCPICRASIIEVGQSHQQR